MKRRLSPRWRWALLTFAALLGVAGSFLASYVGTAMGWYAQGDAAGWIASVLGAVVLLVIYSMVKGKS